ncbi:hypothetical protein MBLNU230_g3094t1 [Neophaeotheca triangularis]
MSQRALPKGPRFAPFELLRPRVPARSSRELPRDAEIRLLANTPLGLSLPYATVKFTVRQQLQRDGTILYQAQDPNRSPTLAKKSSQLDPGGDDVRAAGTDEASFRLLPATEGSTAAEYSRQIVADFPMFRLHKIKGDRPDLRPFARARSTLRRFMRKLYLCEKDWLWQCTTYRNQDLTGKNLLMRRSDTGEWETLNVAADFGELDVDRKYVLQVYSEIFIRERLNCWLQACRTEAIAADASVRPLWPRSLARVAAATAAVGLSDGDTTEDDTTDTDSDEDVAPLHQNDAADTRPKQLEESNMAELGTPGGEMYTAKAGQMEADLLPTPSSSPPTTASDGTDMLEHMALNYGGATSSSTERLRSSSERLILPCLSEPGEATNVPMSQTKPTDTPQRSLEGWTQGHGKRSARLRTTERDTKDSPAKNNSNI